MSIRDDPHQAINTNNPNDKVLRPNIIYVS